jgi:malonyl-CoA/methylmalonyl-CoA synthetase
LWNGATTE